MDTAALAGHGPEPPTLDLGDHTLRPLRAGDEVAWFDYLSDPRVVEHTSIPTPQLDAVRRSVERHIAEYANGLSCRWALANGDDILVGTCGFSNWSLTHRHAELVYDLGQAHWGRGVMSRAVEAALHWAFVAAAFNRVHAFVMTTNQRSIALLERRGFAREGMLRQYRVAREIPRDFYVYARLNTDVAT